MTHKHTACLLLGIMLAASCIAMLALPHTWYALMPGVPATDPLNRHFVPDMGSAYVVAGADGASIRTLAIEPDGHGRIRAIYVVRNPDKLRRVAA